MACVKVAITHLLQTDTTLLGFLAVWVFLQDQLVSCLSLFLVVNLVANSPDRPNHHTIGSNSSLFLCPLHPDDILRRLSSVSGGSDQSAGVSERIVALNMCGSSVTSAGKVVFFANLDCCKFLENAGKLPTT